MEKLSISLENCYGIKKMTYEFLFDKKTTHTIYSPNGVMKTSFAKTLKDISEGKETTDLIFPEKLTKRTVQDENSIDIPKERIFVIDSYNESFKSEKVATLLVNAKLRNEYEKININIESRKNDFLNALKKHSGIKTDIEETISRVFTELNNGFFTALTRIKNEILDDTEPMFEGIIYSSIFSEKTEQFLSSEDIRKEITSYIEKYDELIGHSKFLKRGVFNHTNAATIAKNLKEQGFFQAKHTVNLISDQEKKEIKTEKELEAIIEKEKEQILTNPELASIFNDLDKKLSANQNLRDFREYLLSHINILPELSNLKAFKEKLWISYIKKSKELYLLLVTEYENGKKEMENIVDQAKRERTQWLEVVEIFNNRFSVPFKVMIGNQDQVILNKQAPVIKFDFIDNKNKKNVKEDELLRVLSTGEKRALYLLNILFEVKARQEAKLETIFILDDIADSFDYKNKYAIIEYLKDISEYGIFYQIILTHNYDFFRTCSSRLGVPRQNRLNTEKNDDEIKIIEEKYQNNPFEHWKEHFDNDFMLIASIPFIRNLADYTGNKNMFEKLTSLLHYKNDTDTITINELEILIKTILHDKENLKLLNPSECVIKKIFEVADNIQKESIETLELESKICLSIAIRLKAEIFIVKEMNDNEFWETIKSNQYSKLMDKYKSLFADKVDIIAILEQVNLMTPENIHLNSFMYEPILDISNHHLKNLYQKLSALMGKL